jgi:hypothetical protein
MNMFLHLAYNRQLLNVQKSMRMGQIANDSGITLLDSRRWQSDLLERIGKSTESLSWPSYASFKSLESLSDASDMESTEESLSGQTSHALLVVFLALTKVQSLLPPRPRSTSPAKSTSPQRFSFFRTN